MSQHGAGGTTSPPEPSHPGEALSPSEAAVEALGGTPADVRRDPVSPLRRFLPDQIQHQLSAFDHGVEAGFERLRGKSPIDRLFYTASSLADFSLLWHLVGTGRGLTSPRHQREAVRLGVALGVESVVLNMGIKSLFRRTRPLRQAHERHQLRRPRSSSFPSGHATSGFMAAGLLSEGRPALERVGWHLLATIVAASRVHVGIHYGSDVIAGAAMGAGFGRLVRRLWPLGGAPTR